LSLCWLFRAPILRGAAAVWIVNEPPAKADAIVVLGGGLEDRPFEAARLFHAGLAPKILFMDVRQGPAVKLGIVPSEAELTRKVLIRQGVPETNLVVVGESVTSTFNESVAVRNWIQSSGATRIIIPTGLFHTRRVRWLFRKQLRRTGARVVVRAVNSPQYTAMDWWRHEQGVMAFQNEVLKMAYYWMRY
jgi:uncharacterized SAM-binding protein YcdF (DUF218 family)